MKFVDFKNTAAGALLFGNIIQSLTHSYNYSLLNACRLVMGIYFIIQILQTLLFCFLSPAIEAYHSTPTGSTVLANQPPRDAFFGLHKSKWIVLKLSLLFMIDSFGGSFVLQVVFMHLLVINLITLSCSDYCVGLVLPHLQHAHQ